MSAATDRLAGVESALLAVASAAAPTGAGGSIGVDVVDVNRIRRIRSSNAERFDSLVFTAAEIAYCRSKQNPDIHFGGHLAAKEATFKALGLSWDRAFSWRYFQVSHRPDGSPFITLSDAGARALDPADLTHVSVSIAHTDLVAFAVAWAPKDS